MHATYGGRIALAMGLSIAVAAIGPARAQLQGVGADVFVEDDIGFYGPATNDEFGSRLASGDFDGDGVDDLATGIPLDDNANGEFQDGGLVIIRYGVRGDGLAHNVSFDVLSQFNGGSPNQIFRCPECRVALWSVYGNRPQVLFVRGGTPDEPSAVAPDVHIYTRSKLPWVRLPESVPAFEVYYDPKTLWPAASQERRKAALATTP